MARDSLGRARQPQQDHELEQINRKRRHGGGLIPRSHNVALSEADHRAFAELSPRERGELIKRGLHGA